MGGLAVIDVALDTSSETRGIEQVRALALSRLSSAYSHELRNVLTGVRCYLEILSGVELPAEFAAYRGEVLAGLDRMADLAALWHDTAHGRAASTWVNLELRRLLQLLALAGVGRKLRISSSLDEDAASVSADGTALEAVLLALLAELVGRRPSELRVATVADGDQVVVELSASGGPVGEPGALELEPLGALLGEELAAFREIPGGYELRLAAVPAAAMS